MAENHIQEFVQALRAELKKEKKENRRLDRLNQRGRVPAHVLMRAIINPRSEGDWIELARAVYEQWVLENYPNDV